MFNYKPRINELNEKISKRLKELASKYRKYGAWRPYIILRREGFLVNHKRIERLYRMESLSLRIRRRKKLKAITRAELSPATRANERWSMDFIQDKLWQGRKFRTLSIVDTFSRECLALEVDTSLGGERVKRVLERISQGRGLPEGIVVDNGPEFISQVMDEWAYRRKVKLDFVRPGKPTDNPYVESFHGKFRDECLNMHYFSTLPEARMVIENWRSEYNNFRPHRSLSGMTPEEFASEQNQKPNITQELNLQLA